MKNRPFLAARTALAAAALIALGAAPLAAQALGVGRLNVQSALGEGMRAEIDLTSLTPEEAATLQVRIASPEAYRAAGVDYNAVLTGTHASVVRRADGRPVLRVTSDRAVQEPFVEVILELSWASGRLVREFTLLFDPPGTRQAPPVQATAPVAPVIAAAPLPAPAAPPAPALARPAPAPRPAPVTAPAPAPAPTPDTAVARAPAPQAARPAPAPRAPAPAATPAPARAPAPAAPGGKRYEVRPGDTLYRVATRTQAPGVSLDQMLVGLYRANPDAFIERNVNKLRAGAVLSVPSADEVGDLGAADAKRLISAQSLDFGAYRQRLAQGVPQAQAPEGGRQVQGKVQAAVDDRKQASAPSPDKLKLSAGAAQASAPDGRAAQSGTGKDEAARVAELTRNVEELKKLQQGAAGAQGAAAASAPAPVPAPVAAATASAASPGGTGAGASQPGAVPAALPQPAAAAPVDSAEPGLLEQITGSAWLLPGAGVLVALLAGLGVWTARRRAQAASETSFLESRMQPDSFFGASGGQQVDTRDGGNSGGNSVGYSLSQLDAIGDVDPVAEADVYLAYGRDLQAEEILKEAMRANPERLAVRTKLLEVYAKRRDTKGFELLATQLYALTKGVGDDWARAQELGRGFDAENPLYQPGGHPEEIILDGERVVVEPLSATTQPHSLMAPSTQPPELDEGLPSAGGLDLDLDLDLGMPGEPPAAPAMDATQPLAPHLQRPADLGLDFDEPPRSGAPAARAVQPTQVGDLSLESLRMDLDAPDSRLGGDTQSPSTIADAGRALDFHTDFGASVPATLAGGVPTTPGGLDDLSLDDTDPLARKLELAEEFRQIGDLEGARDLLEEVLAKAGGTLRAKAQTMLDQLG